MDSYADIVVKSEVELVPEHLLSSLFQDLHQALARRSNRTTGVSFPFAGKRLGDRIRLHDTDDTLKELLKAPWLSRNRDYFRVDGPLPVPVGHAWYCVRRRQPSVTAAKARRLVARGSLTELEAEDLLGRSKTLEPPFVHLRSASTGQRFRLFIEQVECGPPTERSEFTSYGLGGVVPWF